MKHTMIDTDIIHQKMFIISFKTRIIILFVFYIKKEHIL